MHSIEIHMDLQVYKHATNICMQHHMSEGLLATVLMRQMAMYSSGFLKGSWKCSVHCNGHLLVGFEPETY